MDSMTIHDVVKKIVGEIEPIGEAHTDERRLVSLLNTCDLVDALIGDIIKVSKCSTRYEHSMKSSGDYATRFLSDLMCELSGHLNGGGA